MSGWCPSNFARALRVGVLALAVGASGTAGAAPGDHIQAGNTTITPGLQVGWEHRTNAYRREVDPLPIDQLRVSPNVEIATQGPDVDFTLGGRYALRYTLQGDRRINLDQFNDFDVNGDLLVLKQKTVGFRLNNSAGLRNYVAESRARTPFHTQFRNALLGESVIRIGAPIEVRVGGGWDFDDYRVPESGRDSSFRPFNSRNTYGPHLNAKWTFFPRTAFVLESSYKLNRWDVNAIQADVPSDLIGSSLAIADSDFIKVTAGLRGRLSERLVLQLMAGYGVGLYHGDSVLDTEGLPLELLDQDLSGLDGLLVHTQAKYILGPRKHVTVGYSRDFRDSWFTNYMTLDKVFSRFDARFGPRFGADASFDMNMEGYRGEVVRNDVRLQAAGSLSYFVQEWMAVRGGVTWWQRASDDRSVEFDDVRINALLDVTY